MTAVILAIHTMIVLALVGVVLLQRSEGGALGMGGGGGGGGGFMSSRGAANVLTRSTSVLAGLFFLTSMVLAWTSDRGVTEADLRRQLTGEETGTVPGLPNETGGDISVEDILGTTPATNDAIESEIVGEKVEDSSQESVESETQSE